MNDPLQQKLDSLSQRLGRMGIDAGSHARRLLGLPPIPDPDPPPAPLVPVAGRPKRNRGKIAAARKQSRKDRNR